MAVHGVVVAGWCGWLLSSGCHVTPGGCQKGGWEGGCACLPGMGTTLSLSSSPAVNQVCVLGASDVVLWRCSCGGCGWSVTIDIMCHHVTMCHQHPHCVAGAHCFGQ